MARVATIVDQAADLHGRLWDVREWRDTPHGFAVALGWPQDLLRGPGGGGVAVVVTHPLAEYLWSTRLRDVDLPIGRTAVKRLRAELSIVWDYDGWWLARLDDLATMTLDRFAARHGCSTGAASQRRRALVNRDAGIGRVSSD